MNTVSPKLNSLFKDLLSDMLTETEKEIADISKMVDEISTDTKSAS